MAASPSIRTDEDLYADAKAVGALLHRSAAQQLSHWARIGRELEAASSVSFRAVGSVLAGAQSYDGLSAEEQAVVRAAWAERIAARIGEVDLAERMIAEGRDHYVELDGEGKVIRKALSPAASPS